MKALTTSTLALILGSVACNKAPQTSRPESDKKEIAKLTRQERPKLAQLAEADMLACNRLSVTDDYFTKAETEKREQERVKAVVKETSLRDLRN